MALTIRPIGFDGEVQRFIGTLWRVYADDPAWIPPLRRQLRDQLNPKKSPFLNYGTAQLFLAERDGDAVGRISAHINPVHDDYHHEWAGFFGFFECLNDPEAAEGLFGAAQAWLTARNVDFIRGPVSFTMNEEVGCLVDGFDSPPLVAMPHGRPYYAGLIEGSGFRKVKDLLVWRYPIDELSPRMQSWHDRILAMPNVHRREFDKKHLQRDVRIATEIFNDAWQDNWGFVPASREEADHLAADLTQFADPRLSGIIEVDGEPAAMFLAIPNLNEVTRDLDGRLFPIGWAKMLWRLHRGPVSGRVILLGMKRKYRTRELAGFAIMLISAVHVAGKARGYQWAELGWILEDNNDLLNLLRDRVPGYVYKTYRIYEKETNRQPATS